VKRPAVSAALRPVLDYFDKRFQDLHDHLDDRIQKVEARVATEVETISELTLGMQRFVDASGREVGELVAALRSLSPGGETAAVLSFALAAARDLPPGAQVLETGWPGPTLGQTLVLLEHSLVSLGADGLEGWAGSDQPLHAVFAAGPPGELLAPDRLDLFRKWLRPDGFAVLAVDGASDVELANDDWDVALRRTYERGVLLRAAPRT
jgi:hypothetical protein